MSGYQPFLIAPLRTGLDSDQEPWMLPADAFTNIANGHLRHGYLEKRQGYRFVASLSSGLEITGATTANPAVFTVNTAASLSNGQTVSIAGMGGGTWVDLDNFDYTIDNLSGTTFELLDSDGNSVDGSSLGAYTANSGRLVYYPGQRAMGLFRFITAANSRELLGADTLRTSIYDSTSFRFDPLDLYDTTGTRYPDADHFSSTDTDYIWAGSWQHAGATNRVYFTNGKAYQAGSPGTDGILYYDGQDSGVHQFRPDVRSGVSLYGCKLIFSMRQRLIILYTYEKPTTTLETYPQRARWCAAQDPTNWDDITPGGGGFVDAPTGDQIVSAQQLRDFIIVFFTDSIWAIRPVSDPSLPFRWEQISSSRACDGKMASLGFDETAVGAGIRGIIATDGSQVARMDERISDFVTETMDTEAFDKVFGQRDYQSQRSWLLYAPNGDEDVNAALIYDEEERAFSTYDISMNVLGFGSLNSDLSASDFTEANNLDLSAEDMGNETALSFFFAGNEDILFGANRSGEVFFLETGNDDNGAEVEFFLSSSSWNPFKAESKEAQLGYIDFYLDSDQLTKLNVEFYKNDDEFPYASQGLDCLPNLNFICQINEIVPKADPTTGFTVYANSHGQVEGNEVYIYGCEQATFYNDTLWEVGSTIEADEFDVDQDITAFGEDITAVTQANPAVVTSVAHGYSNGDTIYIVDVGGMTQLNEEDFTVANVTDDTFELAGIDSTGYGTYTTGGYAFREMNSSPVLVQRRFYRTKVWKRAYCGAIGYQHRISISSAGVDAPLRISAIKPWFRPRGKRILG